MNIFETVAVFIISTIGSVIFSFCTLKLINVLRLKRANVAQYALQNSSFGMSAENAGRALLRFANTGVSLQDFPDKDGDGVPDAFQRRKPLSEILEFDKKPAEPGEPTSPGRISFNPNEYWIAVELPARPPRKGEYFILGGEILRSTINYSESFKAIILKASRDCCPEDLVELTK